jgi:hypothetical protein
MLVFLLVWIFPCFLTSCYFLVTNSIKLCRVRWCLSQFQEESMSDEPTFSGIFNLIHIDEKWFYLTRKSHKFYLALDEP